MTHRLSLFPASCLKFFSYKIPHIVRILGTFIETASNATGISVPTLTKIIVASIVATIIIYTTQEEDAKVLLPGEPFPAFPGAVGSL